MTDKPKRGGAGLGQGRKPKYGEPTKHIAFRVPISKTVEVKEKVNKLLDSFKKNKV
tara:strand:+ start:247 stop:414 length:168 start_codon:yes stop_codon:yes gene_type:complete